MFSFEKDAANNLQTFRNSFIGIGCEYQNESQGSNNLTLYAPFSITYLVKRRGDFFEKNTFNLGMGGIKYGTLTIKSYIYFHEFFKNITPSVQVSIGLGR